MTGLDKITAKIISEAEADAAEITERARDSCAEIMFAATSEAEKVKAELEDAAAKEAEDMIARAKSSATMKKRNLLLETKAKAVDNVFDAAYKEILNLPEEKYCELVSRLIAKALLTQLETEKENIELYGEEEAGIPEKYELVFSPRDQEKLSESILQGVERVVIGKVNRDVLKKLTIAEDTANIDGGVILRFGSIECNCSIHTEFAAIRERMEGEIYSLLFSAEDGK